MISVDWAPLAGPAPWYGVAVANARNVGARAGKMISFLKENVQLSYDDVHVLGFRSGQFGYLPAHRYFRYYDTPPRTARISGLKS